ncbi:hypothetical protein JVX98_00175 (plasmid) [Ensifer sp. PDNC004]|uniref:hypothetical protein n=1 Tax=Ensifer sp. PDNC004 TaxID=2811423 RepID=UPI0019639203|nr:hypothetical protein [Ensifer sp. PDNC004]QRY66364.1 hypothetical protein JVX98_00175 [Ensifer sp. PDNC004]
MDKRSATSSGVEETLDPKDWAELRALSHRIVDDSIDYLSGVRQRRRDERLSSRHHGVFSID